MSSSDTSTPERSGGHAPDDSVLPFQVEALGVRGRIVRLGATITDILERHAYPHSVSGLLAEAVALTSMLGTSLKLDGKFILQTKTDGPLDMLVVDFEAPGRVRAYAHFDAEAVDVLEQAGPPLDQAALLGEGYLAMTIDRGAASDRYQGVVPLEGGGLAHAANTYFAQSEQIPTEVVLSAGQVLAADGQGRSGWRAGGIVIQHLPDQGEPSAMEYGSGDLPDGMELPDIDEDDRWTRARLLVRTAEDHELLDPMLMAERLLLRLYHEDGVRAFRPVDIERHCTCSSRRVEDMLNSFPHHDLDDMAQDGRIEVTCEFCNAVYEFALDALEGTPDQ